MVGDLTQPDVVEGLSSLGFKKLNDNSYYATRYTITGKVSGIDLNQFRNIWPSLEMKTMNKDDVYRPWLSLQKSTLSAVSNSNTVSLTRVKKGPSNRGKTSLDTNQPLTLKSEVSRLQQAVALGKNFLGEFVYKDQEGRFVSTSDGSVVSFSDNKKDGPRYLFAIEAVRFNAEPKIESIIPCAEGFVLSMAESNRNYTSTDLLDTASVWFDIDLQDIKKRNDKGLPLIVAVQRSIEMVLSSKLTSTREATKNLDHNHSLELVHKFSHLYSNRPSITPTQIETQTQIPSAVYTADPLPVFAKVIGDFTRRLHDGSSVVVPFASVGGA